MESQGKRNPERNCPSCGADEGNSQQELAISADALRAQLLRCKRCFYYRCAATELPLL
jgi:DNA-directed RNA polymerase subunit M/transcription elongation factor TFIIS